MLRCALSFLTISILIANQVSCLQEDYYWREYTGTIAQDAVQAGKDINGKDTYIGQAYVNNVGLIVAQIYPEVKHVYAPIYGIKKVETYIKILCGPQENFYWLAAKSTTLPLLLMNKHAVIGGHTNLYGILNIGRISYESETKIGKIDAWSVDNPKFYFNNKNSEGVSEIYEILLYNATDSAVIAYK